MMKTSRTRFSTPRGAAGAIAAGIALGLGLSSCAGTAGTSGDGGGGGGVPAGATAGEYQEALADMPDTTLVFQASASAENGLGAQGYLDFRDSVEEMSDGKLTIELQWAQAIAGYPEIGDALVDGRLDMAYHIPHYEPNEYPVHSALISAAGLAGSSPLVEDLVANAAMNEIAWNNPDLVEEFESKGLHPLHISIPAGSVFAMCTEPGATVADWQGKQARAAATAHANLIQSLGGTPVTLDYLEAYEALQRKTIDCTVGAGAASVVGSAAEVAPHVQYTEDASFGRPAASIMGGQGYSELPLAAQQLIFDQMSIIYQGWRYSDAEANSILAADVRDKNGSYEKMDEDLEQMLSDGVHELIDEHIEAGELPEDIVTTFPEALEKWRGNVSDLGLEDQGGFEDFDEWFDPEQVDLGPYVDQVYEEIFVPHRPN